MVTDISVEFKEQFAKEDAEREARDLNVEYANAVRLLQRGDGTDANPGYLNLMGENAVNAREGHLQALEALNKTMLRKVTSPRVGGLVANAFQSRFGTALDNSVKHFGTQREAANEASEDAHQASIANEANDLLFAGDLDGVAGQASLAGAQAASFAQQTGKDPALAAEVARTAILKSTTERLALTRPGAARAFYDKHRESIAGTERNGIEAMLKKADAAAARLALAQKKEARLAAERARKEQERADKANREETSNNFIARLHDPVFTAAQPLGPVDVVDSNLLPAEKRTFLKELDAEAKGEQEATNETLYNTLFAGVAAGQITPLNFNERVLPLLGRGIKAEDHARLLAFAQSIEGDEENTPLKNFLAMAKAQITQTNLIQNDPAGDRLFFEFTFKLQKKIDIMKKGGSTLSDLLDPESPIYIGPMINFFIRSPQEQLRDLGARMRGAPLIPER